MRFIGALGMHAASIRLLFSSRLLLVSLRRTVDILILHMVIMHKVNNAYTLGQSHMGPAKIMKNCILYIALKDRSGYALRWSSAVGLTTYAQPACHFRQAPFHDSTQTKIFVHHCITTTAKNFWWTSPHGTARS